MKTRIYIIGLVSALIMNTACDTIHEFPNNPANLTQVRLRLKLQLDTTQMSDLLYEKTKSTANDHDVRYSIEIRAQGSNELVRRASVKATLNPDGSRTALIDELVYTAKYRILAWADHVDQGSLTDKFYTTNNLLEVSSVGENPFQGNTDFEEAFASALNVDLSPYAGKEDAIAEIPMVLERPQGKVVFITENAPLSYTTKIEYIGYFPCGFSVHNNAPNGDARLDVWFTAPSITLSSAETQLGFDYVFVNEKQTTFIRARLTVYDPDGQKLAQTTIEENIPIQKGRITKVKGNFLTSNSGPNIGINPDFEGPDINIRID